jgi:hypothetical protein
VGLALTVRTLLFPVRHTVFPVLATGAAHWWADLPLYADYAPLDFFRYPPVFALAVTPLGLLGLRLGGIVWAWLSLLVYGAGVWSFRRDVLPGRWTAGREAVYLLLSLFGALRGLWNGQSNALAVGLLLLGVAAAARRRWWRGAWLLAGAVAVKLTPLAPVLLLTAIWRRQLGGRLLVVLALLGLVPFLTRPAGTVLRQYQDWGQHLAQSSDDRWPGFRDAWTIWLVWRQREAGGALPLREPIRAVWYRVLQLAAAAAALAWCLWQRRRGLPRREMAGLTVAMGLGWLMLLGPAVEHSTYAFLAPLLAWALLEERSGPAARCLSGAAGLLVLVLGWGTLTTPLLPVLPWLWAALPLGTCLFLGWLVLYAEGLGRRVPGGGFPAVLSN